MTNEWSLICRINNLDCELYDLANDYEERNNIIESNPEIDSEVTKRLSELVSNKMYLSVDTVKAKIIPEEKMKSLKSLGYLN